MTDPHLSAAKLRRRAKRSPPPEPLLPEHDTPPETQYSPPPDSGAPFVKSKTHHDSSQQTTLRPKPQPRPTLPPLTHPMNPTSSRPYTLLLASLGNPPPLHTTRHSAGHILLKSLAQHLSCPPFSRSKPHASGHLTRSPDQPNLRLTLWQSPSLMNVSGPAVLKAWKTFLGEHRDSDADTGLILLHDELEAPLGTLRIRRGMQGSVKGHNGLKSVFASFEGAGLKAAMEARLVKVGVGIGRPEGGGRGREEVSQFVLGQVTGREREGIEGLVGRVVGVCEGFGGDDGR